MPFKAVDRTRVPAFDIVAARINAISTEVSISDTGYDFDQHVYRFCLLGVNGRHADLDILQDLLADLRENPSRPSSRYTFEITLHLSGTDELTPTLLRFRGGVKSPAPPRRTS